VYDPVTHIVTNDAVFVQPESVTLVGSFQYLLGLCPGDWQPECAGTHLSLGADGKWTGSFSFWAGTWEYKIAINGSWAENYGVGGVPGGPNYTLVLPSISAITFTYDPQTHIVTTSAAPIVIAAGNFQHFEGCTGDWMPDCISTRLWPKGNIFLWESPLLKGDYEFKITINQSWNENYGEGGVPGGANIPFTVPEDLDWVAITYDPVTHIASTAISGPTSVRRTSWGRLKTIYR
jgi:hypothetical protein